MRPEKIVSALLLFIRKCGLLVMMCIFYGMIPTAVARLVFDMEETRALQFVFLPTVLLLAIVIWPRLPRIMEHMP